MGGAWKDDLIQIDTMLWYAWQCVCSLIESFPDPILPDTPSEGLNGVMEDADMDLLGTSTV
jgi:hypothetical protein